MNEIRTLTCGCCTNGCVCWNHQDPWHNQPMRQCDLHRKEPTREPKPDYPVAQWGEL